jgi:hypothetical protein
VLRFRHGFPEDWKNLVSFWMKIDEEKKRHAENMSFIWNSTVTNNMSLATGKGQIVSLFAVLGIRNRIHIFLGLPDPDPLVRGMDPDKASDPDPNTNSFPFLIKVLSGLEKCMQK